MDKNTITGFLLMLAIVAGFTWYSQPSQEEMLAQQHMQDSIAQVEVKKTQDEMKQKVAEAARIEAETHDTASTLYEARQFKGIQDVTLQNNVLALTISSKGGLISKAVIKDYKNQQGDEVVLFDEKTATMAFTLDGKTDNLQTSEFYFEPTEVTDTTVVMTVPVGPGAMSITYTLRPDVYMVDMTVQTTGLQGMLPSSIKHMGIIWKDDVRQQEKGFTFENRYSSLTYKKFDKGTDYLSETSDEEETPEEALDWVAFKNQFFSCVLITPERFTDAHLLSTPLKEESGFLKSYQADMNVPYDAQSGTVRLQLYMGPNKYRLLQATNDLSLNPDKDLDLEELVYLGWPLFKYINRFFTIYIFDFLSSWGLSMGIVLLLMTIVIKLLVYPTTRKSFLSSARMRVLKPKVDAITAKYPKQEDAMRRQQETMQLYSQYGVSPMGGCLPMLIQMPIWIALFNFVPNAIELRGESFLWANDLSAYDDLIHWDTHIWGLGNHLSIFCLLFCLTNIVNTWISMRQQQNTMSGEQAQQMKMMQYMMYIMPLMFFFMFNDYSSGLNYYYFVSGLISILMMWFLRKTTDDKKLLRQLEERYEANKNKPKKMSSLAARMEELQRLQQEQQKRK